MPVTTTKAAASSQGYGEFTVSAPKVYVEDVFSTYLYTGTGALQTITNGIDLSTKGGLVWLKGRSGATDHALYDTARGTTKDLVSNNTDGETTQSSGLTAFNTTGFTIGSLAKLNTNAATYVSWTFRKQPKFFDVVTWTGDGTFNNSRIINHSINGTVGAIIVKATSASGTNWIAYHRSLPASYFVFLNATNAQTQLVFAGGTYPIQDVTNTTFNVNHGGNSCNASGVTYVAYLFAHDAGGFGLSGTDNVISCGSFTTDGSGNATVTLGYEPQWLLLKQSTGSAASWVVVDSMRGFVSGAATTTSDDATLNPNNSNAEGTNNVGRPTATGFEYGGSVASQTFIYIAIRRGPMKTPTLGTSVFSPIAYSGANGSAQNISAGFPVDVDIIKIRNDGTRDPLNHARLMGGVFLKTDAASAQASFSDNIVSFSAGQNVIGLPATGGGTNEINGASTSNYVAWAFRRAPGFFDVVCYTGNGAVSGSATRSIPHNLASVPELIICKARSDIDGWRVYNQAGGINQILNLNQDSGYQSDTTNWGSPTSTNFLIKYDRNWSGWTFVAYLFATVAGVSKVGSYTGSGTTKQIDCGFTAGARFVLIKRTDSTGDWYVWDSARGIVASTDPYLVLNSTAAEVTTTDWVDTYSAGFELSSAAGNNVNINTASYIFLSIA